jgi:fucose permease
LGDNPPRYFGAPLNPLFFSWLMNAIIPLAVGMLVDTKSPSNALVLPVFCYVLIAGYGWSSRHPF